MKTLQITQLISSRYNHANGMVTFLPSIGMLLSYMEITPPVPTVSPLIFSSTEKFLICSFPGLVVFLISTGKKIPFSSIIKSISFPSLSQLYWQPPSNLIFVYYYIRNYRYYRVPLCIILKKQPTHIQVYRCYFASIEGVDNSTQSFH